MAQNGASVFEWQRILEMKCFLLKDSVQGISQFPGPRYEGIKTDTKTTDHTLLTRKLFHEHLIQKEDSQFTFQFDPLFIFESGKDAHDSLTGLYRNSRGVRVTGSIGKSFTFQSAFLENQAIFPQHIRSFVALREVSPGLGRTKIFKTNGSDFGLAWANFSWNMKSWLNISGGHGKAFIGNGYRSLLLSDNAFFYPFIKATILKKKWSYTHNWSMLQDINLGRELFNPLSEALFFRKLFTWQYFTFQPSKKFEVGIYYSAIWTHSNASGILPLPFVQHLQKYPAGAVNPLAGMNISYRAFKQTLFYGQFMMDGSIGKREGEKNTKMGWQFGGIWHEPFKIKGLTLQGEMNSVEHGAYAQANPNFGYHTGYFHYNQSLAHPLGSNFTEGLGIISYTYKRLFVSMKGSTFSRNKSKIFRRFDLDPVEENSTEQLTQSVLSAGPNALFWGNTSGLIFDNRLGYVINPSTRLKAYLGMFQRNAPGSPNVSYVYVGIGTQILNQYFDF